MAFQVKLYLGTLTLFLVIDFVWIAFIARSFYKKHLGHLMTEEPLILPAMAFYLLFVLGIQVFAVLPALQASSLVRALALGALFGLTCYATYDLTNLATLRGWPWIVTVVDLTWGTSLSALVASAGYLTGAWLEPGR